MYDWEIITYSPDPPKIPPPSRRGEPGRQAGRQTLFRHAQSSRPGYFPSTSTPQGSTHTTPRLPFPPYLCLPIFLNSTPPMTPAATAMPLTMATPMRPSLATLSSISDLRLDACRFAGSRWIRRSLYRRASA